MVFLVILAGGVVRMTQSGMGCPDWPKCFGRWIPPTSVDELPPDFDKYLDKQDIDHTFNVYHTWIEYINRLTGALLGIFIFAHFIWSYRRFRKINRSVVWISFLLLVAVGFQGWLGKKVVDHNLDVVKVTIHMLVALLIAALPLVIIFKLDVRNKVSGRFLKNASVIVLILLLVQVVLGTQVREQVDEVSKSLMYGQRQLWLGDLDRTFLVHRSFSWLLVAACLLLCWKGFKYPPLRSLCILVVGLLLATIVLGIVMYWYDIPALAQPLHLLLASGLVMSVFAFRLKIK
jgi:cytochrome c oxidase assembly protein subunit 15